MCLYVVKTDVSVLGLGTTTETGTGAKRSHQEQGETSEESSRAHRVHTHAAHHTQLCAAHCRGGGLRSCDSLSHVLHPVATPIYIKLLSK